MKGSSGNRAAHGSSATSDRLLLACLKALKEAANFAAPPQTNSRPADGEVRGPASAPLELQPQQQPSVLLGPPSPTGGLTFSMGALGTPRRHRTSPRGRGDSPRELAASTSPSHCLSTPTWMPSNRPAASCEFSLTSEPGEEASQQQLQRPKRHRHNLSAGHLSASDSPLMGDGATVDSCNGGALSPGATHMQWDLGADAEGNLAVGCNMVDAANDLPPLRLDEPTADHHGAAAALASQPSVSTLLRQLSPGAMDACWSPAAAAAAAASSAPHPDVDSPAGAAGDPLGDAGELLRLRWAEGEEARTMFADLLTDMDVVQAPTPPPYEPGQAPSPLQGPPAGPSAAAKAEQLDTPLGVAPMAAAPAASPALPAEVQAAVAAGRAAAIELPTIEAVSSGSGATSAVSLHCDSGPRPGASPASSAEGSVGVGGAACSSGGGFGSYKEVAGAAGAAEDALLALGGVAQALWQEALAALESSLQQGVSLQSPRPLNAAAGAPTRSQRASGHQTPVSASISPGTGPTRAAPAGGLQSPVSAPLSPGFGPVPSRSLTGEHQRLAGSKRPMGPPGNHPSPVTLPQSRSLNHMAVSSASGSPVHETFQVPQSLCMPDLTLSPPNARGHGSCKSAPLSPMVSPISPVGFKVPSPPGQSSGAIRLSGNSSVRGSGNRRGTSRGNTSPGSSSMAQQRRPLVVNRSPSKRPLVVSVADPSKPVQLLRIPDLNALPPKHDISMAEAPASQPISAPRTLSNGSSSSSAGPQGPFRSNPAVTGGRHSSPFRGAPGGSSPLPGRAAAAAPQFNPTALWGAGGKQAGGKGRGTPQQGRADAVTVGLIEGIVDLLVPAVAVGAPAAGRPAGGDVAGEELLSVLMDAVAATKGPGARQ